MKILHYYLGPHRQGGLNRYATDLSQAQAMMGNEVFCLYPNGGILPFKRFKIQYEGKNQNVSCYKFLGGIPIPLLEGIHDPEMILTSHPLQAQTCEEFVNELQPEILHIHTWMGFPSELLCFMKKRKGKVVFTTHDYFGLCPKVNFINEKNTFCTSPDDERCSRCNRHAPGKCFLALRNWDLLMKGKKYLRPFLKCLPKRTKICSQEDAQPLIIRNYIKLQAFYLSLLKQCDRIHFNSRISEKVYRHYLPEAVGEIIPITHAGILDRRTIHEIKGKIRLGFIGSDIPYKGLPLLLKTVARLQKEGFHNWSLDIWGNETKSSGSPDIRYHGTFSASEQEKVLLFTNLLIVPSIWPETFGFVVEEALSMGIPVLCSDLVGAQVLVTPEMVYHEEEGLYQALKQILLTPEFLMEESRKIGTRKPFKELSSHVQDIFQFYLNTRK